MTPKSEQPSSPDAAVVYEANAALIYDTASWFLPHTAVNELVQEIAQELMTAIPLSGYTRYVNLVCLRTLFAHLQKAGKSPIDLELDPAFCLFLRERYNFSCKEIAAIVGVSEGSIRTRLERARARAFAKPIEETLTKSNEPHACIRARELIEDWNLTGAQLGERSVPAAVGRAVSACAKCDQALRQRLASITYFRDLPTVEITETLKKFPLTPLFVKEGKRFMLNWSAAPWYVKALFEGMLATTLVLGIVLSIPRIKSLYEFWLERRLDLYSVAELAAGLSTQYDAGTPDAPASNDQNKTAASLKETALPPGFVGPLPSAAPHVEHATTQVKPESEFIGRDSLAISSDRIYRILIKTDSPEATKDQALKLIKTISYVPYEQGSVGAELPGGVMFDIFVPIKNYKQLEADLVRLGETKVVYTRAKERGMPGKARVKIWLQRI